MEATERTVVGEGIQLREDLNWACKGGRKGRKGEQVITCWTGDGRQATLPEKRAVGPCVFEDKRRKTGWGGLNSEASECQAHASQGQLKETVFPIHLNLS